MVGVGLLAVLAVLAVITVALPALDRALPAARPVPPGRPYAVGGGVTVVPPPDAILNVSITRPGPDRGTAGFSIGSIRYTIVVRPYQGGLDTALRDLRRRITEAPGYRTTSPESAIAADGLAGRQGGYAAPSRAGRYAVFVAGPVVVEVTFAGPIDELAARQAAVLASIATLRYAATR
jgi:hypothetical protein